MKIKGFPYEQFQKFVENLQQGKSFLINGQSITLQVKDIDDCIKLIDKKSADQIKTAISGLSDYDNKKIILLHAYWLWYFPYNFESGETKLEDFFGEKLLSRIDKAFLNNENRLAGMGMVASHLHDEVIWILKNVFNEIINTSNYDQFKISFKKKWGNSKDNVSSKNLLLHIMNKDDFEPIAVTNEKKKIVEAFSSLTNATLIDDALKEIRTNLGMDNVDSFYDAKYSKFWKKDLSSPGQKLLYKKAMILYGPPGTGKTYTAFEMAKFIIARYYLKNNISFNFDDFLNKKHEDLVNDEHISYLQFHINYNYEDFIAGQTIEHGDVRTKKGFIFDVIKKAAPAVTPAAPAVTPAAPAVTPAATAATPAATAATPAATAATASVTAATAAATAARASVTAATAAATAATAAAMAATAAATAVRAATLTNYRSFIRSNYISNYNYSSNGIRGNYIICNTTAHTANKKVGASAATPATGATNKRPPYIVILDEINRTDISRVFGELFTAIEKRGTDVTLMLPDPENPENKLTLNIPDNIYFIGTMNEIDFSLERVDFALRRRFVWELMDYDKDALEKIILSRLKELKITVDAEIEGFVDSYCKACTSLNDNVAKVNSLGEAYHIGHAFFAEIANIYKELDDDDCKKRWKTAKEILWQISIKPTLDAYCGSMDKAEKEKYLKDNNQSKGEFYIAFGL